MGALNPGDASDPPRSAVSGRVPYWRVGLLTGPSLNREKEHLTKVKVYDSL